MIDPIQLEDLTSDHLKEAATIHDENGDLVWDCRRAPAFYGPGRGTAETLNVGVLAPADAIHRRILALGGGPEDLVAVPN